MSYWEHFTFYEKEFRTIMGQAGCKDEEIDALEKLMLKCNNHDAVKAVELITCYAMICRQSVLYLAIDTPHE